MNTLLEISDELAQAVDSLRFPAPITHVYNPLIYTRAAHADYLQKYGQPTPREIVLFGMNPGPWGMAQTGVPFGHVPLIRDWLKVEGEIQKPPQEHPKRPVDGLQCPRKEVSGARLWGWAKERYHAPECFFSRFFVSCYCPLSFMEENGRNRTPDKLPKAHREQLFPPCDKAMRQVVELLQPRFVLGVGKFAEQRARLALDGLDVTIGCILHPSPANPHAGPNWGEKAEAEMRELGIQL